MFWLRQMRIAQTHFKFHVSSNVVATPHWLVGWVIIPHSFQNEFVSEATPTIVFVFVNALKPNQNEGQVHTHAGHQISQCESFCATQRIFSALSRSTAMEGYCNLICKACTMNVGNKYCISKSYFFLTLYQVLLLKQIQDIFLSPHPHIPAPPPAIPLPFICPHLRFN